MVLCLIALPVFAVLSIFSIKFRTLTKEALQCIFRTVTLRKCQSGLDDRIKAKATGTILKFSPKAAQFFFRYFSIISWLLLALFIWSMYVSAIGIYNYAVYGNCNGPASTGFCLLDPTGAHSGVSEVETELDTQKTIEIPQKENDDPILGNENAPLTVIEFGCYGCPFTKKAEATVKEVLAYYDGKVNVQFKSFVIPRHTMSLDSARAADCAYEQGKYTPYHDALFGHQDTLDNGSLMIFAKNLDLNMTQFSACVSSGKYTDEVNQDTLQGMRAGVKGTPTFFIGNKSIVGPKPFKTFKKIIDEELAHG